MKDDLQLGKLKENCLLLKLYRKLRKTFLHEPLTGIEHFLYTVHIGTKRADIVDLFAFKCFV